MRDVINKMLTKDPKKRVTWKELFESQLGGESLLLY